jgi:hypothetical protein
VDGGMLWRNGCDGKVLRCGAGNRHQQLFPQQAPYGFPLRHEGFITPQVIMYRYRYCRSFNIYRTVSKSTPASPSAAPGTVRGRGRTLGSLFRVRGLYNLPSWELWCSVWLYL